MNTARALITTKAASHLKTTSTIARAEPMMKKRTGSTSSKGAQERREKNADIQCSVLDRDATKSEVASGHENRFTTGKHMDEKSITVEPKPRLNNKNDQKRRKIKKRREDDLNEFIKVQETEDSRGSDLRNNDT